MKNNISLWQFIGFDIAALGGTLLHFMYDWTNKSVLIAPFSGVNESTWEHMKLLFFPLFIFALVQSHFFKEYENFWCIKFIGITIGLLLIPILFYTYNGVFGKSPDWINIAIFFISAAVSFILETKLFKAEHLPCKSPKLAFSLILLIALLFVVFTFAPPHIPLFKDPITGTYGVNI